MSKIQELTDINFDQETQNGPLPVLVDFWAQWCGPCRALASVLEQLAIQMQDKVKITKIDIENYPEISSKMGIRSIPTMLLFKSGKLQATKTGFVTKEILESWLNDNLTSQLNPSK